MPSPEAGVRQVKLDTIPADIVESVEVNKTLSANQDGDAIGGSVNIRTKTAGDLPTLSLEGIGGFTPILNTRYVYQMVGTVVSALAPASNLAPSFPEATTTTAAASTTSNLRPILISHPLTTTASTSVNTDKTHSLRLRRFARLQTRRRLGSLSPLFESDFKDYGDKWVYSLNAEDLRRSRTHLVCPTTASTIWQSAANMSTPNPG